MSKIGFCLPFVSADARLSYGTPNQIAAGLTHAYSWDGHVVAGMRRRYIAAAGLACAERMEAGMGISKQAAVGLGRMTHWALRHLAHRSASQLPGRVALALDHDVIAELAPKLRRGSVVICGTNGKTTTTNLVASALEAEGLRVLCNREGANMAAGVAAALLPHTWADWAVIEADELSTVHVVPALKPTYLVLLNLFRDQLDRAGEIDHVQDTLVEALAGSPATVLVACGDDPLCMGVARRAREQGTRVLTFGMGEDLGLTPDRVPEARFCQVCGAELVYDYRSYAQLGAFRCPNGDFARPQLDVLATKVQVGAEGVSLRVAGTGLGTAAGAEADADAARHGGAAHAGLGSVDAGEEARVLLDDAPTTIHLSSGGVYMAYNLLAAATAARLAGASWDAVNSALADFDPHNGRLQHFSVGGRDVILNLAKNPTGFNQNLSLLEQDARPRAVYVVVNDNYNDGKDISWIWDVDFERLAAARSGTVHGEDAAAEAQGAAADDAGLVGRTVRVMVGGLRANDLQVRMKYAGIEAEVVPDVAQALERVRDLPADLPLYVLCNYSALAPAKEELERLEEAGCGQGVATARQDVPAETRASALSSPAAPEDKAPMHGNPQRKLVVAHLFPELLNLYGDSGNILCLRKRMAWRGIEADVREVHVGDVASFADVDLVFIGGGSDREQRIVCEYLLKQQHELAAYVEDGGVLAAVCGGYQLLGHYYMLGDEKVAGLELVDLVTDRGSPRIIGNIAVESSLCDQPIVGYENHGGRTYLGSGVAPLGRVLYGHGNDAESGYEGCRYKNVVGTYIHGPLLPKNPGVADWLIGTALDRRYGDAGLETLDDAAELTANKVMLERLHA